MNPDEKAAARNRKPVLSDLKDCGALEPDADFVEFTYRVLRMKKKHGCNLAFADFIDPAGL